MQNYRFFFFLGTCLLFSSVELHAQGCSDAGFCTMGAMKPNQKHHKQRAVQLRSLEISSYVGMTDFNDWISSVTVDFGISLGKKYQAQIKLPYQRVSGPLGENHDIGDLSLSVTRNLVTKDQYTINATLGGKIPIGNPTARDEEGRMLPMYYQATLGTYDLVAGLSLVSRKWILAVGYQQPLNTIENEFVWGPWLKDESVPQSLKDQVNEYPISPNLARGKDAMLRVERNLRFSKFNLSFGLLGIYRLDKDKIQKEESEITYVAGTDGLVLNGLFGGSYRLTPRSSISLMNGVRMLKRERNPDGLSRKFVSTVGYEFRF